MILFRKIILNQQIKNRETESFKQQSIVFGLSIRNFESDLFAVSY